MRRTTGILILLAMAGGCSNFQQGPSVGARGCCDGRLPPVPGPAPLTTWTENDHLPRSLQYQYTGGSGGPISPAAQAACQMVVMNETAPGPVTGTVTATATSTGPKMVEQTLPPINPDLKPASLSLPEAETKVTAKADAILPPLNAVPAKVVEPTLPPVVTQAAKASPPSVRMVNSKRITINYEVKEVGPSGLSAIELWYTQDGKSWKKRDISPTAQPPYVIEVNEEGLYGFTLLARNGIGLAKDPPKSGDLPQVWVEVDMTKPLVTLTGINAKCTANSQNVVIRWTAADKNLAPRAISLSYAEKEAGPWIPIAANLENTGRFEWPLPASAPSRFLVRVEARDTVGNVGLAQTPKPVLMDRAQPVVSITTVEGAK